MARPAKKQPTPAAAAQPVVPVDRHYLTADQKLALLQLQHEDDLADQLKDKFLRGLARYGTVSAATKYARIHRTTAYMWRERDAEFAAAWDATRELVGERLETAAVKRAVEGVKKPIYQGGVLVGHQVEYSDTLLALLLKANLPEKYRERSQVEHSGGVQVEYVSDWRGSGEPHDANSH